MVEIRIFGDPVERLRTALLDAKGIFKRKPADILSLAELLKGAAEVTAKEHATPLLLVIDQFEEFLILHDEARRAALTALLNGLGKDPIDGLRLLLVFRSDYRALVFKLGLPPLSSGENWYEISPYDRSEGQSMLQGGGRELSPNALDALFRGLDRIEDARGLYRPITLNMIGLVLEAMGGTLRGDPSKLIQTYLMDSLTASTSRDFVKPLLSDMITDAGTKEPRSEAELAGKTHFEQWQVRAVLADLARRGLVRRLEGMEATWEVAHDFLARTIGQLIGRLKPTFVERIRPLIAPVVLLGWMILFAAALPFWKVSHELATEKALQELFKATISAVQPSGISVDLDDSDLDDSELAKAVPLLEQLDDLASVKVGGKITSLEPLTALTKLSSLSLWDAPAITSLEPLKRLINLSVLDVSIAENIASLEPLKSLTKLSRLELSDATGVTSLEPLRGLTNLSSLSLGFARGITSLEPLRGLTNLSELDVSGAPGIISLEPLKDLTSLLSLDFAGDESIISLEPLKGLTKLSSLRLQGAQGITSLEPLKYLTNLAQLDLSQTSVMSLDPLKGLTNLSDLNLAVTRITSLEPLQGLTNLSMLDLTNVTGITSLEPLKGLINLSVLDLSGARRIASLEPLKGLTKLSRLGLSGVTGITSLEPLKGMKVRIIGASENLLATMK